jgi:hypothetical protein
VKEIENTFSAKVSSHLFLCTLIQVKKKTVMYTVVLQLESIQRLFIFLWLVVLCSAHIEGDPVYDAHFANTLDDIRCFAIDSLDTVSKNSQCERLVQHVFGGEL